MIDAAMQEERRGPAIMTAPAAAASAGESAVAVYRVLCGHDPASARVADNVAFDRHVFASLLAVGASEPGSLTSRVGLESGDLACLLERWFPNVDGLLDRPGSSCGGIDDEVAMVRDLLLAHRSTAGDDGRWLAAMVARRALEPNHLWEDLGLRDRGELSRLLSLHFAPLAARNTRNMRWKRFFYRALCESDGFVMCTTPVCTVCHDFDLCFGAEDGESRLARARREHGTTGSLS